jgi:hypothetical protein
MSSTQTQSPAQAQAAAPLVAANMFSLTGGGLHVSYSTSGIDGKPHFSYQDATRSLSFSGDEIRKLEGDLATVVSVTIVRTVDAGSTSFSLLVPHVNVPPFGSVSIYTFGITTHHAFSIVPAFNRGQRDFYHVTALHGTASNVVS